MLTTTSNVRRALQDVCVTEFGMSDKLARGYLMENGPIAIGSIARWSSCS